MAKTKTAKIKIEFDKEKCIGCGACVATCEENWEMDGDKAKPKKTVLDDIGCNQAAADGCPVECIKIIK